MRRQRKKGGGINSEVNSVGEDQDGRSPAVSQKLLETNWQKKKKKKGETVEPGRREEKNKQTTTLNAEQQKKTKRRRERDVDDGLPSGTIF